MAGRTRHIDVKQYFLRELKEAGIVEVHWKSGDEMTSDIFTKNCSVPLFKNHASKFVGVDEYMKDKISNHDGTPKGRVSKDENCESRMQDKDKYDEVMHFIMHG